MLHIDQRNPIRNLMKRPIPNLLSLLLLCWSFSLLPDAANAQKDGAIDTTLNYGYSRRYLRTEIAPGDGFSNGTVQMIIPGADGSSLIGGGTLPTYNGRNCSKIVKLFADGGVDSSFRSARVISGTPQDGWQDSNGDYYLYGSALRYQLNTWQGLLKVRANGTLDTNFKATMAKRSTNQESSLSKAVPLPGNKFLVTSDFATIQGQAVNRLARLDSRGLLDLTFNQGGTGPNNNVYDMLVMSSGKIIIAGNFTSYNGVAVNYICRLNPDGSLDPSFVAPASNGNIFTLAKRADEKIFIAGAFTNYAGATRTSPLLLDTNGAHVASFVPPSNTSAPTILSMVVLRNNNLLICGSYATFSGSASVKYLTNLSSTGWFATSAVSVDATCRTLAPTPDGGVLVGGQFRDVGGVSTSGLFKMRIDGRLDRRFNQGLGPKGNVNKVVPLSGGKVLVTGSFSSWNGYARESMLRINQNGTVDTTFLAPIMAQGVNDFEVLSSGKIIVGTSSFNIPGARDYLLRLNADGSYDNTFLSGLAGPQGFVNQVEVTSAGKIYILGYFNIVNGQTRRSIALLNADGSLDANFNSGSGLTYLGSLAATLTAMEVLSGNQIIVGGRFDTYNGTAVGKLIKIRTNGSIESNFSTGSGISYVQANVIEIHQIMELPNSTVLVSGTFDTYNGTAVSKLIRLSSTGVLDPTYKLDVGVGSGQGWGFARQTNGQIILSGLLYFDGSFIPNFALRRLLSTGRPDTNFVEPTTTSTTYGFGLALDGAGKLYGFGNWSRINGETRGRFIRMTVDENCLAPIISTQPRAIAGCPGNSGTTTFNHSGSGPFTYIWRKGTTEVERTTIPTLTFPSLLPTNAGSYTVEVIGKCGNITSSAFAVTVATGTTITTRPASFTGCQGGAGNLAVVATGTNLSYRWYRGTTILTNNSSTLPFSNLTLADTGNYRVVVTGACGKDSSTFVRVNVLPQTQITLQPTALTTLCAGGRLVLRAAAIGNGALSYKWLRGTTTVSTLDSIVIPAVAASDSGTYTFSVTSTCGTINANTARVQVRANTVITTQMQSFSVCEGVNRILRVVALGDNLSYEWYKDGALIFSNPNFFMTNISLSDAGKYWVRVTGSCGVVTGDTVFVRVNPKTRGAITRTITQGSTYLFNGRQLGVGGTYLDTLQNRNGCDSILTLTLTVVTSIDAARNPADFSLYPNPVSHNMVINRNEDGPAALRIITAHGLILKAETLAGYKSTLDVTTLPAGIYWVELSSGGQTKRQRIIKE